MRMTKRSVLAFGLVAAAAAVSLWIVYGRVTQEAGPADEALVALGKAVYAARCASCHGANLEGQPNWQQRLPNGRLPPPPHDAHGHTWHHPDRELFRITQDGTAGVLPGYASDMPGFKDVLSSREIWAVLAYIKSTWPEDIRAKQERINEEVERAGRDGR